MDLLLINQTLTLIMNLVYFFLVFSIILVVVLDNRNPVKTMAWILVLLFIPFMGIIIYIFLGRSNRKQRLISKKGYSRLSKRPMQEYQMQNSFRTDVVQHKSMDFFSKVNSALTFGGNGVKIFTDGNSMLLDMLREIARAKNHIHLEFYILEDDAAGRLLRDALIDKAREGVKVRVLYDDVGCWKVKHSFYEQMLCDGIEVQSFLKVRFPRFTSRVNYRNHRKILLVDGKVGYIGGMNIALRYLKGVEWGRWRDTQVKITGKAVYGLQTAFLKDWYVMDRTLFTSAEYFPKLEDGGISIAQIVTSDPIGEWKDIMQGLMMIICSARKYLYIQSPYLLPTEQIKTALQTAALAGVDVRVMLPERADSWLIHKGSLSYIDELLKAGVKIYFYCEGFLHSKLMVCDDSVSSVGSTNMDFRSFENNFEANAFFYDSGTALALKNIFLKDQQSCRLLDHKTWKCRPMKERVVESIVRLFAPLL